MLHFANPVFLLLLLAVPPLVWWWLRTGRGALRYPNTGWLVVLPNGRSLWVARCGAALRGGALVFLVIALAGIRWPDRGSRIPTEGIAIQMVVDTSPSMGERDFDWQGLPLSRLEAAQRAFRLFVAGDKDTSITAEGLQPDEHLPGRPSDLIGLVTFGDRPEVACPLTLSHAVLLHLLDGVRPLPVSETNISDALVLALHRLDRSGPKRKVLVLLSDGEHNYLSPRSDWTPRQAAQIAANLEVPIYAIDTGGEPSAEESSAVREQGIRTLHDLARITGGQYFQARDAAGLLAACRAIDKQERATIESFQYRRFHEGFRWFGIAAFALFVTAAVLDRTLWLRVP
jgi:Ca-activated chloride channel family protein